MDSDKPFYEIELESDEPDPQATPLRDRKVITQPYDLAIESIVGQVKSDTLFLRPLKQRPNFQRQYVWPDKFASKLVESVLLNVPIPPCYLSENEERELDVIDGQQRIFSLFRFHENQFKLSKLEVLKEFNGLHFFELPSKEQRKINTHTLRCVVVTNESHPDIKFDVFERLNTNTVPLNPQELRNCVSRGALNNLLGELSYDKRWLAIRGRKKPDRRLADEELILRFYAYRILGLNSYKTPLKIWLNDAAKMGRKFNSDKIESLQNLWSSSLDVALTLQEPERCFRRPSSKPINRALFDLTMNLAVSTSIEDAKKHSKQFKRSLDKLCNSEEFSDLIRRAVDHKSRTVRRFQIWDEEMSKVFS